MVLHAGVSHFRARGRAEGLDSGPSGSFGLQVRITRECASTRLG